MEETNADERSLSPGEEGMMEGQYPLDFSEIRKGDVIAASVIADITQKTPGTDEYRLAGMKLAQRIKDALADLDLPVVVKWEKHDLRILTDEEAAGYTDERFHAGIRVSRRSFRAQVDVDVSNLTDETKTKHDRRVEINGRILAAIVSETRRIALTGYQRSTPTLEVKKK